MPDASHAGAFALLRLIAERGAAPTGNDIRAEMQRLRDAAAELARYAAEADERDAAK